MNMFSLRTIIDDILLIVRNNNISESEDLSRQQIATWVIAYKALLNKKQQDKESEDGWSEDPNDSLQSTIGPLELIDDPDSIDNPCIHRRKTKHKLPEIDGHVADNIISVSDADGCVIQYMHRKRRHYHYFRRYTYGEVTCWYDNGYMYVEGMADLGNLRWIYVTGVFLYDPDKDGEDDIKIPGWMIPDIKRMIMQNELAFMLNRPSDDSNNSTLASVKPHGPQDDEE